jgi:Bacterial aa3 type cytochrome c oxidase subunit IV
MAQSGTSGGHAHGGQMDIADQRQTFHGFLIATLWTCTLIAQIVALSTVAFAMGFGWWSGLLAFVAIGAAIGLLFRMSGVYWAVQVALWVLGAIGGALVGGLTGMMG